MDGRGLDLEADRRRATDFARRAHEAAGNDPITVANAAFALAYFGEDIGAMMALVDRALAVNPSFARGWQISGVLRLWAGEPDTAIEHAQTALRLSPNARFGTPALLIGTAYLVSRRFDEAIPKLLLAIQEDPSLPVTYRNLAACYAHMGRLGKAQETVKRLCAISPVVVPSVLPFRNPEHRDLVLSGLRLAAGEAA
jgi:adenylate cyclase